MGVFARGWVQSPGPLRESHRLVRLVPPQSDQAEKSLGFDEIGILGSDGGTYYVGESKLTAENAAVVLRCLVELSIFGSRTDSAASPVART